MNVIIIDDELPAIRLLKRQLEQQENIQIVAEFSNSLEASQQITDYDVDVVFLDIEMPIVNGIELASIIDQKMLNTMVVFVTSYDNYALDAFKVNAIDYLVKPITTEKAEKCIKKIIRLRQLKEERTIDSNCKIKCFGQPQVITPEGVVKWPTKKTEELFYYFYVYSSNTISIRELEEFIWTNTDNKKVKSNIHTTVYRLRKVLHTYGIPMTIESSKGGDGSYIVNSSFMDCDLDIFMNYFKSESSYNIDNVENVIVCYTGRLFVGKDFSWSKSMSEWVHNKYMIAVKGLIHDYIDLVDYEKAYNYILAAKEFDNLDEQIHEYELEILVKQGMKGNAVEKHEKYVNAYIEFYGLKPNININLIK